MKYASLLVTFCMSFSLAAEALPVRRVVGEATDQALQTLTNARASINGEVASLYAGACKAAPGETQAESDRIEERYFPVAAKKLVNINRCETLSLTKLLNAGYRGRFILKVTKDIAVKLPALRKLSGEVLKMTSDLEEWTKQNDGYDRQIARFGFLDDRQKIARLKLGAQMAKASRELKPRTAAYKTLLASIWRADEPAMASYLAAAIQSQISVQDFRSRALAPQPNWYHRHLQGNFSFLDQVLKPMISDAQSIMKSINADYRQTANGRKFVPGYLTRKLLATNMDTLYEPEQPSQRFKNLACHLDQKYSSGEDDIGTTISIAMLFGGPVGKFIPMVLRVAKLEKLIEGSLVVDRALAAMGALSAGTMVAMTADSAYQSCTTHFGAVNRSAETCSANSTIEDVTNFQSNVMDKDNCELMVISTAISQTTFAHATKLLGGLFDKNSSFVAYLNTANQYSQAAFRLKNQGMQIKDTGGTAKDFIQLLSPDKKDADKPGDAKAGDDNGDDKDGEK